MVKRQSRDQEKREICIYKKMFSIYLQKGTPIGKKKPNLAMNYLVLPINMEQLSCCCPMNVLYKIRYSIYLIVIKKINGLSKHFIP